MTTSRHGGLVAKILALTALLALVANNGALGRLVGSGRPDPILGELVEFLDTKGVDVVAGETGKIRSTKRPRIAKLSGMPATPPANFANVAWMRDFVSGAMGVLTGVKTQGTGSAASDADAFLASWSNAAPERRVFLSFTKADVEAAAKAREALESRGYITFMFLNPGGAPRYDATVVGKLFSEAGHHLVLDTPNARRSPGVFLESSMLAGFTAGRIAPANRIPPAANQGPAGPPKDTKLTAAGPGTPPSTGGPGSGSVFASDFDKDAFLAGVKGKWIVTENPSVPRKLFIHREVRGGALVGLLYLVKVEADGSWTVYDPNGTGVPSFGRRLGSMQRPAGVSIGNCTCI